MIASINRGDGAKVTSKMTHIPGLIVALSVLAVTFAGFGCDSPARQPTGDIARDILGRWSARYRPWKVDFESDGTVQMSTIGTAKRGRYHLVGSGAPPYSTAEVYMDMENGGRFKATVSMKDAETLILTDPDGTSVEFKRLS